MNRVVLLFSLLLIGLTGHSRPIPIVVQGDAVNLRAAPDLESEVLSQVNFGDQLQALDIGTNWVKVLPPDGLGFWVHQEFLFENRQVKVRELNVRAGPGTQFTVVGSLARGDLVRVQEQQGDWVRIEPPQGSALYVARDYVLVPEASPTPTPQPRATPTPRPTPSPLPTPEVRIVERVTRVEVEVPVYLPPPTPTPQPPLPGDLNLVPLDGQGIYATRTGTVRAYLLAGSRPSRFRLVVMDHGAERSVCYLKGDEEVLKPFVDKRVLVRGRDYWVSGESLPVMMPTRIERAE